MARKDRREAPACAGASKYRTRFFLGVVVIARAKHPIPSRTRPLSAVAPMVLHLKVWESRSPPNLERNASLLYDSNNRRAQTAQRVRKTKALKKRCCSAKRTVAGWSSPVARQAHNLKVTGSNPVPATKIPIHINMLKAALRAVFCVPNSRSTIGQQNGESCDGEERDL